MDDLLYLYDIICGRLIELVYDLTGENVSMV